MPMPRDAPLRAVEFYCGIGGLHYSLQVRGLIEGCSGHAAAPNERGANTCGVAVRSAPGRTTLKW